MLYQNIVEVISHSERFVVLTGAGISTDSGIPDYRSSAESLWRKNPLLLGKLNQESFETEPKNFWQAYFELIETTLSNLVPVPSQESLISAVEGIQPNFGHEFFVWLEQEKGKRVTIVTQNVDGLHKQAGSSHVIEMHGNVHEYFCPNCHRSYSLTYVLKNRPLPACECGNVLRPNLVFFGDSVHHYGEAVKEVEEAEVIIVVGTSLQVAPFNRLIYSRSSKARLILINDMNLEEFDFHDVAIGNIVTVTRNLKKDLDDHK